MTKLKYLRWWDIIIITVIMIGMGIYQSNVIFLTTSQTSPADYSTNIVFTLQDNLKGILNQSIQLIIALLYLRWRNFDFRQWNIKINWKNTVFGILLFLICAVSMDLWFGIWNYLIFPAASVYSEVKPVLDSGFLYGAANKFSVILYSLLNGPYEEIFFLGICLSVRPEYRKYAFWYSMLIRISFHTYQGLDSAFGIGILLTVIYYFFYTRKNNNLYPYFLSHTIADIIGLGIIYCIIYLLYTI